MMHALALALASLAAPGGVELHDAEVAWQARGGPAGVDAAQARAARTMFESLVATSPGDLGRRLQLIEALYFEAHFVTPADSPERAELVDRAVAQAELALATAAASSDPQQRAAAELWAAIAWGYWGYERGWLAAARRSVATRVRDHATRAAELDPAYRDGGGERILGRLHAVAPRVPLITGWIDHQLGIRLLERAVARSTRDPRNQLFLAEALLEHAPARRCEAVALLEAVAERRPDPAEWIEQAETIGQARARLAKTDRRDCAPPPRETPSTLPTERRAPHRRELGLSRTTSGAGHR